MVLSGASGALSGTSGVLSGAPEVLSGTSGVLSEGQLGASGVLSGTSEMPSEGQLGVQGVLSEERLGPSVALALASVAQERLSRAEPLAVQGDPGRQPQGLRVHPMAAVPPQRPVARIANTSCFGGTATATAATSGLLLRGDR